MSGDKKTITDIVLINNVNRNTKAAFSLAEMGYFHYLCAVSKESLFNYLYVISSQCCPVREDRALFKNMIPYSRYI